MAYADEIADLGWQKGIEPARHEQYRGLEIPGSILSVDLDPVAISLGMIHPIVEKGDLFSGSAVIGFQERKPVIPLPKGLRGGRHVPLTATQHRPVKSTLQ